MRYFILGLALLCFNSVFAQQNDSLVYSLTNKTIYDFYHKLNEQDTPHPNVTYYEALFYMDTRQDYPAPDYNRWKSTLTGDLIRDLRPISDNFRSVILGDDETYLYCDSLKSLRYQLTYFEGGKWDCSLLPMVHCTDSLRDYAYMESSKRQKLSDKVYTPIRFGLRILYPYIFELEGDTYGLVYFIKYDLDARYSSLRTHTFSPFDEDFWMLYKLEGEGWEHVTFSTHLLLTEYDVSNAYEAK